MVFSRKVNSTLAKQMNQQLVLQIIQSRGPISRKDITLISGLSPAAVSGITGALIDLGLVQEVGEAESEGRAGRKAILLRLRPDAGYVVGVKLAVHTISCVVTDLDANVLYFTDRRLPFAGDDDRIPEAFPPQSVIQATIEVVEDALAAAEIERSRLLGIGVGVNGIVDSARGISVLAPHFGWRNESIVAPLTEHFGIPVYLENDARALTIAEQWFGAGRGVDHFVTIALGYGIGSGVVTNGRLYRGGESGAGEFGHIVLQEGGPLCSCGRRGCLESLAGVPAIIRRVEEALASGETSVLSSEQALSVEAITNAADAGDPLARRALAEAGHWMGTGMACLVNILNPQLLVINGEGVRFGRWYFEPMETTLRQLSFDGLANQLPIIVEPRGHEMWARGAACVVLSELFTSPVRQHGLSPDGKLRAFAMA